MIQRITIGAGPQSGDADGSCCGGSASAPGESERPAGAGTTTYSVQGMTCGHCVAAVRGELLKLPGVRDVGVELVAGGVSTVTVTADAAPEESAVRDAVDEAGYQLLGPSS
jgi:copper chaperone CopZ